MISALSLLHHNGTSSTTNFVVKSALFPSSSSDTYYQPTLFNATQPSQPYLDVSQSSFFCDRENYTTRAADDDDVVLLATEEVRGANLNPREEEEGGGSVGAKLPTLIYWHVGWRHRWRWKCLHSWEGRIHTRKNIKQYYLQYLVVKFKSSVLC